MLSAQQQLDALAIQYPRALRVIPGESHGQRLKQRMKQEPLIPLGMPAFTPKVHSTNFSVGLFSTVAVFCGMVYHSRRGNSRQVQLWMRYRIASQGLTVCAIVWGMYRIKQDTLEYNKGLEMVRDQVAAEKTEKSAFEERLQQAEAAYEAESGLRTSRKKSDNQQPSKRWYHYLSWSKTDPKDKA